MRWKRWLVLSGLVLAGLVVLFFLVFEVLLILASQAPDFYQAKIELDSAQALRMSDQFLQKTTALSSEVQRPGTWFERFTEDEINAWLAVDLPKNHPQALPEGFSDPRVKIDQDRLRFAMRARHGLLSGIVNAEIGVYLTEPNTLVVVIHKLAMGALPLPLQPVIERLKKLAAEAGWEVREMQKDGAPSFVITIPAHSDGKGQLFELKMLHLVEGAVELSGAVRKR